MAVLTDILIAPPNDASAIVAQWPGSKNWPAFETTGLDALVLAELAEALDRPSLATAIRNLAPSAGDNADGPWVFVLPTEFRDRIAGIPAGRIGALAQAWSDKEETRAGGLTSQAAEQLVLGLQALAARARDGQKPLLLWISL